MPWVALYWLSVNGAVIGWMIWLLRTPVAKPREEDDGPEPDRS